MLVSKPRSTFTRVPIASGQTIVAGKAVNITNGEAHLADKDSDKITHGFCKGVDGSYAIIQVDGKIDVDYSVSLVPYWLSTSGGVSTTAPTEGVVQKVAEGLTSSSLLITIDNTVILL